jgi:VWFA-related protein
VEKSIGVILLLAGAAWAQPPTFSTGTRLVQVDAIVRGSHGPVAGLTRDDFTLLDNGKLQKIAVFSVRSAARNPDVRPAPLPVGAVSNRVNRLGETPASATILLIDRQNTPASDQAYANRKVVKFLEARGNRDSLGIYILSNTLRVVQDLTDDPERLDRALKSLKPQEAKGLTSDVTVDKTGDAITDQMLARSLEGLDDIILQTKATSLKDALEAIARHLSKVPGRKNLVWVSGSFPLFVRRATYNLDFTPEMQAAGKALNDANVAIYPVDARGLAGTLSMPGSVANAETGGGRGCNPALGECIMPGPGRIGEPSGLDTMNTLASLTGGRAFYNTNGIEDSIAKAVEDAELTYTLGFYPAEGSLDGTYHKLTVKLMKRGGSVHHRGGYIASKAMIGPDQVAAIGELMRDPLEATSLGLVAQATADAARPGSWTVRVNVDLHDVRLEHEGARRSGAVDLSFMLGASGKIRTKTIRIDIPDDQFDAAMERGISTVEPLESDGQAKDLRVVAQDRTTGAAGSVRVPLRH